MSRPPQPSPVADAALPPAAAATRLGVLWSIDVGSVDPARIAGDAGAAALDALFSEVVRALDLHVVTPARWHVFPAPHRGVTGLVGLSESHLACHTYPEHGAMTLDLHTCRERAGLDWAALAQRHVGRAGQPVVVHVTRIDRTVGGAR